MKISGFSYIRNGFRYSYPFLQSVQSILPICDEFIIAIGNSEDGTKEAIEGIGSPKIKIINTVWDENLKSNGKIFAQQANIALREITGDWAFHLQADEVIHENDIDKIREHIRASDNDRRIEGLLFGFLNFYGSFNCLNDTRYQHKKEIRIFRNNSNIFSYMDSQGFRKYPSCNDYLNGHKGYKLKVKYIKVPVYHYSYVRSPGKMQAKSKYFETFWHDESYIAEKYNSEQEFNYYTIERIKFFNGSHPAIMKDYIENERWDFNPAKINRQLSLKDKILYWIEDRINYRLGEYRNYILAG